MIDDVVAMYKNRLVRKLDEKTFQTVYPPYFNYKVREPLQLMISFPRYAKYYPDHKEKE